jgi:nucleoside-diphosphate-sugar epimerase
VASQQVTSRTSDPLAADRLRIQRIRPLTWPASPTATSDAHRNAGGLAVIPMGWHCTRDNARGRDEPGPVERLPGGRTGWTSASLAGKAPRTCLLPRLRRRISGAHAGSYGGQGYKRTRGGSVRILVAGDRGYIGAVLVPVLQSAGHIVDGLDLGLYEGCDLGEAARWPAGRAVRDIRDVAPAELAGYDAVVCLAALSNDPLGHLNPAATYSVNLDGTLALAQAAKAAGVPRFLFSSSCSLYGSAGSAAVAEDAALLPVTPYGETKVLAEQGLSALADDEFSPTYLRNATAYGASPRLRLDVVVNNLTAVAFATGKVRLESDGSPWRPLVHVLDISAAFAAMLEAPRELVHDQAFNIGRSEDNAQIRQIAEMVRAAVPGSSLSFADGAGPDLRDYRVDFAKLEDTFPALKLRWTIPDGISELLSAYDAYGMTPGIFASSRYIRIRRIRELLDAGAIDTTLRRTSQDGTGAGSTTRSD